MAVPLRVGSNDDPLVALNCTMSGSKPTQLEISKKVLPFLLEAKRNIERDGGTAYLNRG